MIVTGGTSVYEKISSVSVNQHNYTASSKIKLTLTSSRYGRLCKFSSNFSLFVIISPPNISLYLIIYPLVLVLFPFSLPKYKLSASPVLSPFFYLPLSQLYSCLSCVQLHLWGVSITTPPFSSFKYLSHICFLL